MTEQVPPSPGSLELRTRPLASARLNRKAVFAAIGVLAIILGFVIVNVSKGQRAKASPGEQSASRDLQPALNAAKDLTKDIPDFAAPPLKLTEEPPLPPPPSARGGGATVKSQEQDAMRADTLVSRFVEHEQLRPAFAGMSAENTASQRDESDPGATGAPTNTDMGAVSGRARGALLRTADYNTGAESDQNQQEEKQTFLRKGERSTYLGSKLTAPVSPFELKTGTVIPGVLISAVSSDLPGEIIAQVAENVYDTASGRYLLIPQGSKLFGHYDSQVSFGQRRVLVSWQRLIYPNAYTLELQGMSGHDGEGQSGFSDRVNNHLGRVFGWGLLTSMLSAGFQLSQPEQANSLVPSNGQVAAAAVGQQMAQLGAQIASRNMQVQPTIEIRKGYRLNVMVNKDVIFPGSYPQ